MTEEYGMPVMLYHKNAPDGMTWLRIRDGYGMPGSTFWTPAWALEKHGWYEKDGRAISLATTDERTTPPPQPPQAPASK
jgi:hypothetical protein